MDVHVFYNVTGSHKKWLESRPPAGEKHSNIKKQNIIILTVYSNHAL